MGLVGRLFTSYFRFRIIYNKDGRDREVYEKLPTFLKIERDARKRGINWHSFDYTWLYNRCTCSSLRLVCRDEGKVYDSQLTTAIRFLGTKKEGIHREDDNKTTVLCGITQSYQVMYIFCN